ncbi:UDP-glycosyltransferase 71E1 [Tanacetum coccineum]
MLNLNSYYKLMIGDVNQRSLSLAVCEWPFNLEVGVQVSLETCDIVGGFVSHCGWNSTLESIWCGVPIAAWPLYAEQQINAFQLVVELGIAAEIRMDYRSDMRRGINNMTVAAEEIEDGIRRLMNDHEMRNKVKQMKEKSRFAVLEGGSSYASIGRFIHHLNI